MEAQAKFYLIVRKPDSTFSPKMLGDNGKVYTEVDAMGRAVSLGEQGYEVTILRATTRVRPVAQVKVEAL